MNCKVLLQPSQAYDFLWLHKIYDLKILCLCLITLKGTCSAYEIKMYWNVVYFIFFLPLIKRKLTVHVP